jgi:hypothetical protein
MPDIPANTRLFGRTLDDATNSYKFFWLQALLSTVDYQSATVISLRDLVGEMIVAAWHPVALYRLSLGRETCCSARWHRYTPSPGFLPPLPSSTGWVWHSAPT